MRIRPSVLYFSARSSAVPTLVHQLAEARGLPIRGFNDADEVMAMMLRGHPSILFLDADDAGDVGLELARRLKSDAYTAIVPVTALGGEHRPERVKAWFASGADEVLTSVFSLEEQRARVEAMLARTERDVAVHPSTRLPGTTEIEREIRRRLDGGAEFAVCYADLDHFKEFNDRYSYYDGDRVILLLSRILHDVVKGLLGTMGFVGHIGGDDFIFVVPVDQIGPVCTEILAVFDGLIPVQYSDQDRRAGYFFGKDRRGQLHRVPLMTLSIGIVTNRNRSFQHPAQISELATEMKSYAKTLPGSVYVVDRRRGAEVRSGDSPAVTTAARTE